MELNGCGVALHDIECLCDVHCHGLKITGDAVYNMWQGERIAEILGYGWHGQAWTPTRILHYLETVTMVHDRFLTDWEYDVETWDDIIQPVLPAVGTSGECWIRWGIIRNSVKSTVAQFPDAGVIEVIEKLGFTLDQFQEAITSNKVSSRLSAKQFNSITRELIHAGKVNYRKIGRENNASMWTVRNLGIMFKPAREAITARLGECHGN